MKSALSTAGSLADVTYTLPLLVQGLLPQGNLVAKDMSEKGNFNLQTTLLSPPLTARMLPETDQLTCHTTVLNKALPNEQVPNNVVFKGATNAK